MTDTLIPLPFFCFDDQFGEVDADSLFLAEKMNQDVSRVDQNPLRAATAFDVSDRLADSGADFGDFVGDGFPVPDVHHRRDDDAVEKRRDAADIVDFDLFALLFVDGFQDHLQFHFVHIFSPRFR